MLFWIFIFLTILSFVFMIWGFVSSKEIAVVESASEGFANDVSVLQDTKEVDLDYSDGKIGISREFKYGKQANASASASYSTENMVKAWRSDDRKLKFSIAAIIIGLLGMVLFLGLAFISKGGTQTAVGIVIIVVGLLALMPFFKGLRKTSKSN